MAAIKKTALTALAAFVFSLFPMLAGSSRAEDYASFSAHYYDITPGLTIKKPSFALNKDFSLETNFYTRITVDKVESGGSDALSGASASTSTRGRDTDVRRELSTGLTHVTGDWKIEGGYLVSIEEDYRSQAPSIIVSRDFFQRNTTVSAGFSRSVDEVFGFYMSEAKDKDVNSYSISVTQVLSPWTLAQAGYTFSDGSGFMGTGNRRVTLSSGAETDEFLPDSRKREAVGLRVAQWLPWNAAIHGTYRWYRDDWKVDSNTVQLLYHQFLSETLRVRAEYRYYDQDAAYFVRDTYDGTEEFLTPANSLKKFDASLYGVKLTWAPREPLNLDLEAKYERYEQSIGIEGDIFMVGLRKYLH